MKTFKFGYSVYVSTFNVQKDFLEKNKGEDILVFTSLHIAEEMQDDYVVKVKEMLKWLKEKGFIIVGDISRRTLQQFGCDSIIELALLLQIDQLRIDYGFTVEEIRVAAKEYPIVLNASTLDLEEIKAIQQEAKSITAIHNFYPRAYTALGIEQFLTLNDRLRAYGIQVYSFIPNKEKSRGPIYEGLPTLEHQRDQAPYVSVLQLWYSQSVEGILLSDLEMNSDEIGYLDTLRKDTIVTVPVHLEKGYEYLDGKVYTIRADSPDYVLRLKESREYATQGEWNEPYNCIERAYGVITCDNKGYKRYSGEIQILKTVLPADKRVNVVGEIVEKYKGICECIPNNTKIKFRHIEK